MEDVMMLIATATIAVATVINVILFCVFQQKQNKLVKVDVAMQYIHFYLRRLRQVGKEWEDISEKCDDKSSDETEEKMMKVKESAVSDLKTMNKLFAKLGMKEIVDDATASLKEAFKE